MKRQFTIIEMLVVIAIIITLMAMMMGGFSLARKKAMKTKARSQVTFLLTAISSYNTTYGSFPYTLQYNTGKAEADLTDLLIMDGASTTPAQLLSALYGQDTALNPRGIAFIETDIVDTDPWGNSYRIAIDLSYDGKIKDDKIYGSSELVKDTVVWSRGPDGLDSSTDSDAVNNDNITSWGH